MGFRSVYDRRVVSDHFAKCKNLNLRGRDKPCFFVIGKSPNYVVTAVDIRTSVGGQESNSGVSYSLLLPRLLGIMNNEMAISDCNRAEWSNMRPGKGMWRERNVF